MLTPAQIALNRVDVALLILVRQLLPAVALLASGCSHWKDAPSATVAPLGDATTAEIAGLKTENIALKEQLAAQKDLAQRAAGSVYGVQNANTHNPDGLPKEAVAAQATEAESALPAPTAEQKLAKETENARILAGELAAVKTEMGQRISGNEKLKADVATRDTKIADLEKQSVVLAEKAERERKEAATKLQKQFDEMSAEITRASEEGEKAVQKAKREADAKLNFWLQIGLMGGGALLIVLGFVAAQLAATIPIFGPNIARAFFLAGGSAFVLGMLVRAVDRFVDQHPYIFYGGLVALVLGIIAAAILFYANHHHAKAST